MLRWSSFAIALAVGIALVPAPASAAPAGDWTVTPVDGGYQVTLHLSEPLEARDALPELAVDGTSLGVAQESPDGRTLTVVTTDPRAAAPGSVELAWNGEVPGDPLVPDTARRGSGHFPGQPGPAPDPTGTGPFAVARADYDLGDTALTLSGLGGRVVEERAAVWVPVGLGRRPVVLFLHGRHSACFNPTTRTSDNTHWPCVAGYQPIASFHGYDQSAAVLASHGYVVVSISADGVNAQDNPYSDDAGTLARGQLVLQHLDLLARADAGRAPGLSPRLRGRLDLTDVGLMGHSRGGEGMVKAALLNAGRRSPYGIRAVLPLAPIDFGRETLPDVPMAVILPYCDGDVSNLQGQHFFDDTRFAHPSDDVLRSSLLVMGADHNFFNTEWTPGVAVAPASDDWSNQNDPTCGPNSATTTRLTPAQQYQVGVAYIAGFFRLVMGHETRFLPMFDNGGSVAVGAATVLQEVQSPSSRRADIAPLVGPDPGVTFSAGLSARYCASMGNRSAPTGLPSCTLSTFTGRFPPFTPANYATNVPTGQLLHLSWTAPGTMAVRVPYNIDSRRYDALTFRVALDDLNTDADLTVTVVDGAGRRQSVALSSLSEALTVLPGTGTTLLPKTWLRTVRWPLARLRQVNAGDLRRIELSTATPAGGVFLSDLALQSAGVGDGGPSRLPQVSIEGAAVNEGSGPGTATVTLRVSAPSRSPVSVYVQALAGTGTQIATAAQRVVIPPLRTAVTVEVPVIGNLTPATTVDTVYKVFVIATANAVVGQNSARITVHDDD